MNKDVPYALFSCAQDEFGEESAILREWYTDLRPIGLQSLTAWLEKRRAPKRRKHMEQLLEQYGCVGLEGFLRVTHALSLNDTFWVKEESETLCWDEVSLYRNEFDALIAQAAFSGIISEESPLGKIFDSPAYVMVGDQLTLSKEPLLFLPMRVTSFGDTQPLKKRLRIS